MAERGARDFDRFPIDPDVDREEDLRHHPGAVAEAERTRWPRLHGSVVAVIFVGGCAGGLLRYAVTDAWTSGAGSFPWSTYAVNVAGAFLLAVIVVLATDVVRASLLRPLLGTGFCGALTTFSSIVVTTDQLVARGHAATASLYLVASVGSGIAAVALGLLLMRGLTARLRPAAAGEPA